MFIIIFMKEIYRPQIETNRGEVIIIYQIEKTARNTVVIVKSALNIKRNEHGFH